MTHDDTDNLAWYFNELDRPDLDDLWPDDFYDEEGPFVQELEGPGSQVEGGVGTPIG